MRCLFLAPMKAPDHPLPSGDRAMARLFFRLLGRVGYQVELVSKLSTRTKEPSAERWQALEDAAEAELHRILDGAGGGERADRLRLHLPPLLQGAGPDRPAPRRGARRALCGGRGDPRAAPQRGPVRARPRAGGARHRRRRPRAQSDDARPRDGRTLQARGAAHRRPQAVLRPRRLAAGRAACATRARASSRLVTVAMMRPGNKLASHHQLAEALARLGRPFRLDMIGDGPTRDEVHAAFAPLGDQVRFHGMIEDRAVLARFYREADLFVWPGVGEAYGAVYLEAQAHGLPCVAGDNGGVPDVIRDGETGILAPRGDIDAYAGAIRTLADDERCARATPMRPGVSPARSGPSKRRSAPWKRHWTPPAYRGQQHERSADTSEDDAKARHDRGDAPARRRPPRPHGRGRPRFGRGRLARHHRLRRPAGAHRAARRLRTGAIAAACIASAPISAPCSPATARWRTPPIWRAAARHCWRRSRRSARMR